MQKIICIRAKKLLITLLIQSVLLTNNVWAVEAQKSVENSYLSPSLNIGFTNLNQLFLELYFYKLPQILADLQSLNTYTDALVVGVPEEIMQGEGRVGLTPLGVRVLTKRGIKVIVQSGAGIAGEIGGSRYSDEEYRQAGAIIVKTAREVWENAGLIVKVKEPQNNEIKYIRKRQIIFTYFHLAPARKLTTALIDSGATCIAYETVIVDGETPLLKPMSKIAGVEGAYVAAILKSMVKVDNKTIVNMDEIKAKVLKINSEVVEKVLENKQQTRSLTGINPGNVVIFGGGIVSINAALTFLRLGSAEVTITETVSSKRLKLKELFNELGFADKVNVLGDNRRKVSKTESEKQNDVVLMEKLKDSGIILSGVYTKRAKPALVLNEKELKDIGKGKVIVDVSIDQGGSIYGAKKTTHKDPVYIDDVNNNIRYAVANMPGAIPHVASNMLEQAKIKYLIALLVLQDKAVKIYPELIPGYNIKNGKLLDYQIADDQNRTFSRRPAEINSPFDEFTPEVLHSKIAEVIRDRILKDTDITQLEEIRVSFEKSNDDHFNDLVSQDKQKRKEQRKPKGERDPLKLEGLTEHYRQKDPEFYDMRSSKRKKEFYIKKLCKTQGEDKGYYQPLTLGQLQGMYYKQVAEQRFRDDLTKDSHVEWIDFTVNIKLKNEEIKTVIRAQKEGDDFRVFILAEKETEAGKEEAAQFLFAHLDSPTRQQLHILSDPENANNQTNDLLTTALISRLLLKALEISSNKSAEEFTQADRRNIEQLLRRVIAWAKRTSKKDGVREKQQVGQLLSKIIASDGHLKNGEPEKSVSMLEIAFALIKKRMEWLIESIKRRNDIILAKAVFSQDWILYSEGLKNKIIETQGRICLGQMKEARAALSFIEQALLTEYGFYTRDNFGASLKSIMNVLEQMENQQIPEHALELIEEVDFYIKQQADNLRAIYKWFMDRGFDKYGLDSQMNYTQILRGIIQDLDSIQTPGRKYLDIIDGVISKIDNLAALINLQAKTSGKIKGVQKQILPRLDGVRKALVLTREKVITRNEKLKELVKRKYRFTDVIDAKNKIKNTIVMNKASIYYGELIDKIHEQLNTLYLQILSMQQNISAEQGPQKIDHILEQLLKKENFEHIKSADELVLQAI